MKKVLTNCLTYAIIQTQTRETDINKGGLIKEGVPYIRNQANQILTGARFAEASEGLTRDRGLPEGTAKGAARSGP